MKLLGVDLTLYLLERALRTARGEAVDDWTPEINLAVAGNLPDDWIPDADVRLALYMRLARAIRSAGLDALEAEIEDRFGAIPPPARTLVDASRVRVLARTAGIARIDAGPSYAAGSAARPTDSLQPA